MTAIAETGQSQGARKPRPRRVGRVVSDKGNKTIKVVYEFTAQHRKYGKYHRRSTTAHVHDENNEARVGDLVELMSCRRISKTKCWRLIKILRRAD